MEIIALLEQRIRKSIGEFNGAFYDLEWQHEKFSYGEERKITQQERLAQSEQVDILEEKMENLAGGIYRQLLAYFELLQIPVYLNQFMQDLQPILKDKKKILKGKYSEEHGEVFSSFVETVWNYFLPVSAANENEHTMLKSTSIQLLENLLENTAVTLSDLNKFPIRETDISSVMNVICKAAFPEAQFPTEIFQKTAICYKPDVLIPHLKCAIEYKLANTEKALAKTIEQILIDVEAYAHNHSYRVFYAVFYVKAGVLSKKRFEKLWNEKQFPDSWHPIFVEAHLKDKL